MAKNVTKTTKTATVADARKLALKTAAADKAKLAKKPVVAKKAAKPAPKPATTKAGWGEKSTLIYSLATRKEGMSASDIKEVTGWKSVSAKAIADRFAVTWGNAENGGKAFKVVKVERKDGVAAYRFA